MTPPTWPDFLDYMRAFEARIDRRLDRIDGRLSDLELERAERAAMRRAVKAAWAAIGTSVAALVGLLARAIQ